MSTLFNLTETTPEKVNIVKGTVNDRKCIDGFIEVTIAYSYILIRLVQEEICNKYSIFKNKM